MPSPSSGDSAGASSERSCAFRMPAEWEPHQATLLAWPHELTDWPGKFAPIPWVFAEIVRHLARAERVWLLVENRRAEGRARGILERAGADLAQVDFFRVPTDRGWMRDCGPVCARSAAGEIVWRDFAFNGWAKYPNHKKDAKVVARLAARLRQRARHPERRRRRIVLEGGSIDVNGKGALLTTEECLLSDRQERNPGFTRSDYEAVFGETLGATKVIWLKRGIAGDDTHGHVDDLARFVDARTIVAAIESDPGEANYAPLRENLALLERATDPQGRSLRIETLPMPAPVWFAGQRLPASYANFYLANGTALVPVFNDPNDRVALNTLEKLLPGRQIAPVYSRDLVLGLGTLHCLTQQIPAAG